MSEKVGRQQGFTLIEVLLAMVLMIMVVTMLAGYHRALASRFVMLDQYRQLWRHGWNQAQLASSPLPEGWQINRGQTTHAGCVSISVTLISPLGRQGQITRLHCPTSK